MTNLNERILDDAEIVKDEQLPAGILARVRRTVCRFGVKNENRRVYDREVWEDVLADEKFQRRLKNRQILGNCEHPEHTQLKLVPDATSHVISNVWIDEDTNTLKQDFDLLPTPAGHFIHVLHNAGVRVEASTRAEGELEEAIDESGEKYSRVKRGSYRYITTDCTGDASCQGTEPESIINAVRKGYESKEIGKELACALLEMAGSDNAKKLEEAIRADLQHEDCKCPIDKKSCNNCKHAKESVKESLVDPKAKIAESIGVSEKSEPPAFMKSSSYADTEKDAIKAFLANAESDGVTELKAVKDPAASRTWLILTKYYDRARGDGDMPGHDVHVIYLTDKLVDFETGRNTKKFIDQYKNVPWQSISLFDVPKDTHESKTHDRYEALKAEIKALYAQMQAETDPAKKREIELKREELRQEKMDIEDHWKELGRESVAEGKKVEAFKSWLQKEHSMDRNAFYDISEEEQKTLMRQFDKVYSKMKKEFDVPKDDEKVDESKINEDSSEGRVFEIDIKKFLADKDYELRGSRFVVVIGSKGWLLVQDEAVHWKANLGEPVKTAVWDKMLWDPKTGSGKSSMYPRETPELIELHDLEKAAIPQSSPEPFDWTEFIHYWGIKPRMEYNYGLLQKSAKEIGAFVDFPAWGAERTSKTNKDVEEKIVNESSFDYDAIETKMAKHGFSHLAGQFEDFERSSYFKSPKSDDDYVSQFLSYMRDLQTGKKLKESWTPVMSTEPARILFGKILDYLLIADDPAYNKIVGFKKQIDKLPVSADKENLIKWFNQEFRPNWDPRLGGTEKTAWDYYDKFDESKITESTELYCPWCDGMIKDTEKNKDGEIVCGNCQFNFSRDEEIKESSYMLADDEQKDPTYDEEKKVYTVAYLKDGQRVVAVFKDKEKATYFFDKVKARQKPNESKVNEVSFTDLDSILSKGKDLTLEELIAAVKLSIAEEFSATELYKKIADATDNVMAKKVMQSVADEESVHAGEFRKLLATLDPKEEDLQKKGEQEVAKESSKGKLKESLLKVGDKVKYQGKEHVVKAIDLEDYLVELDLGDGKSVTVTPEEIEDFMTTKESKVNETVLGTEVYFKFKAGSEANLEKAKDAILFAARDNHIGIVGRSHNKATSEFSFTVKRGGGHNYNPDDLKKIFNDAIADLGGFVSELKEAKGNWSVQHAYDAKYNKKFDDKDAAIKHAKSFRKGKDYDGNYYVVNPEGKMINDDTGEVIEADGVDSAVLTKITEAYKKLAVGAEAEIPTGNAQLVYSVEGVVGEKFRVERDGTMLPKGEYEILSKDTDAKTSGPWGTFSYLKVRKIGELKAESPSRMADDGPNYEADNESTVSEASKTDEIDARIKEIEDYKAGKKKDIVVGHGYPDIDAELKALKDMKLGVHPKQAQSPSRMADDGPNYEADNESKIEPALSESIDVKVAGGALHLGSLILASVDFRDASVFKKFSEELQRNSGNVVVKIDRGDYLFGTAELSPVGDLTPDAAERMLLYFKGIADSRNKDYSIGGPSESKGGAVPAQRSREAAMLDAKLHAASDEYSKLEARLKNLEECYASDIMDMTAKILDAREEHSRIFAKLSKAQTELSEMVQTLRNTEKESLRVIQELKQSHERKLSTLEESKKKELSKMADAHQSELDALVAEHKKQMLHKYVECRIRFSGLSLSESVRALLEQCNTEEKVESVLEQYRRMIREGVHFTAASLTVIDGKAQPKSALQERFETAASAMIGTRK